MLLQQLVYTATGLNMATTAQHLQLLLAASMYKDCTLTACSVSAQGKQHTCSGSSVWNGEQISDEGDN